MKRQNVRTLALIVVTFTYLLIGAAIFDALESNHEERQKFAMDKEQDIYVRKYNISHEDFEEIYKLVLKMKPFKAGTQWKFAGSFYFATTVITTIGYGHSTPKTKGGKIFCMIYALPGIPLTIVMFQSIGERMNIFITCLLQYMKLVCRRKTSKISQTKLILISMNFVSLVIIFGAIIFTVYEDWTFLNSVYYCFITLTTIGFGDLVALQKNDSIAKRPDYVAFSLIFILFGLTVVSSVMNLLVLRFLTMNTEDERKDEIVAAIDYAIDNRDFNNGGMIKRNDIHNKPKIPSNAYENAGMSCDSSHSDCSCLCIQRARRRIWISNLQCINNEERSIFTRSCWKGSDINNIDKYPTSPNNKIQLQWSVSSSRRFPGRRKRYTVIRGPAPVRHLAESGYMRQYQCSPPLIKIDQLPPIHRFGLSLRYKRESFRTSENGSGSSNQCDDDSQAGFDSNLCLALVSEYRRRRCATI